MGSKKLAWIKLLLGLIALLCFILRAPFFPEPLDYDEGNYSFYALQATAGGGFFSTLWTSRPPLLVFLYAFVYSIRRSSLALRIFSALTGVYSTLIIYKLAKLLFNTKTGLFSALIFAIFSSNYAIEGAKSNAEVFMIALTITAFYLFFLSKKRKRKSLLILSGLAAGGAFLIKQVAVFAFFGLLLGNLTESFWQKKKIKEKLKKKLWLNFLLVFAFLTPLLSLAFYFYLTGRFEDFIRYTFSEGISYVKSSHANRFTSLWVPFRTNFKNIFPKTFVFWLLALAGFLEILISKKNLILIYWSTFAFFGVCLGGWFFPHYFIQLAPPLSLLGGVFMAEILNQSFRFSKNLCLLLTGILAFLLILSLKPNLNYLPGYLAYLSGKIKRNEYLEQHNLPLWRDRREVGEYLKKRMKNEEKLFVWDSSSVIYFYSQKPCFYKYGLDMPFLNPKLVSSTVKNLFSNPEEKQQELIALLVSDPPDYLVIRAEPEKIFDEMRIFPGFATFVWQNYEFAESFNTVLVYHLKEEVKKITPFHKENPLIPLELIKRFSAITQLKIEKGTTEITFEPMVNPEGILRSFKATYPEVIKIDFEPITLEFFAKDGYDFVGGGSYQPSGTIDLHLKTKGIKKPISFVRVKVGKITFNNRAYGVNPPLRVIQNQDTLDLFFEPPWGWQGQTCSVYFIYQDGSISNQDIKITNE